MNFNCVKTEIDELVIRKDIIEDELVDAQILVSDLEGELYDVDLLLTSFDKMLDSLESEQLLELETDYLDVCKGLSCLDDFYEKSSDSVFDDADFDAPGWIDIYPPVDETNLEYIETIKTEYKHVPFWSVSNKKLETRYVNDQSDRDFVSTDYHVKLLYEELNSIEKDVPVFVSNDTDSNSAIGIDYLAGKKFRVIPPIPVGQLAILPGVSSVDVISNLSMVTAIINKRLSIWVSFDDFANTFGIKDGE